MILVRRPAVIPRALARGVAVTQDNCNLRDSDPVQALAGKLKFNLSKGIYGTRAVKKAFAAAQSDKCCFCEGVFNAHYIGDVEHYRPKGAVREGKKVIYPGYYWLAFEFRNLFFACADCNQYRKRDQFPLVDEGARARSHRDNVDLEDPLILDPSGPRDPRLHIRFFHDVPVGISDAGRRTIIALKLDREPLNQARRKLIRRLKDHLSTVRNLQNDPRPEIVDKVTFARLELAEAVRPDAEFSAAAQDFLVGWTPP
jgi:hypothetical protein